MLIRYAKKSFCLFSAKNIVSTRISCFFWVRKIFCAFARLSDHRFLFAPPCAPSMIEAPPASAALLRIAAHGGAVSPTSLFPFPGEGMRRLINRKFFDRLSGFAPYFPFLWCCRKPPKKASLFGDPRTAAIPEKETPVPSLGRGQRVGRLINTNFLTDPFSSVISEHFPVFHSPLSDEKAAFA